MFDPTLVRANMLNITAGIAGESAVTFTYTDADGVQSLRHAVPSAVHRCKNGYLTVSAYDLNRLAPRSFRFDRIGEAIDGDYHAARITVRSAFTNDAALDGSIV